MKKYGGGESEVSDGLGKSWGKVSEMAVNVKHHPTDHSKPKPKPKKTSFCLRKLNAIIPISYPDTVGNMQIHQILWKKASNELLIFLSFLLSSLHCYFLLLLISHIIDNAIHATFFFICITFCIQYAFLWFTFISLPLFFGNVSFHF